jgi:hypothetical protein
MTSAEVALGADCAQALEGAMRAWQPVERECDLAAGSPRGWRNT